MKNYSDFKSLVLAALALLAALSMSAQSMGGYEDLQSKFENLPSTEKELQDLRPDVIRAKMDSIRVNRNRPTVALVLSGGGAKGAASVGAMKYLEKAGIPVDMVLGTSIGGLLGSLFALGYDAEEAERLMRSLDWDMILSDNIPREYKSYSSIKYKEKYALSFPFFNEKQKQDTTRIRGRRRQEVHFGAEGGSDATEVVSGSLASSLPSGMVQGINVGNLFSSLSVGYQDAMDFYDLPIPFLCVAADMVTGTAKVLSEGKLTTAMRSTMSIPGLFTPVRVDGMVLVDGGIRNNYPTDLAKKCGADIVIGIDLASGYKGYGEINNLADIIGSGVDMLGRTSYEANVGIPDLTIAPSLEEFNMMSFDEQSVDIMIGRGYEAALAKAAQIDSLKRIIGPDTTDLASPKAKDLRAEKVAVSGVRITGLRDDESERLVAEIDIEPGQKLGSEDMESLVARMFATNAFESVSYELLGEDEPYELVFNCRKGPTGRIGVGVRGDSEEVLAILLNAGFGVNRVQGSALDLTVKISTNPFAKAEYSYINRRGTTVNLMASVKYTDKNTFSLGNNAFRINFLDIRQELSLSNIKWSNFFFRTGIRNDYFSVSEMMASQAVGDYNADQLSNDYVSLFFTGRNDSFDNAYIPTKGKSIGVSYDWVFAGFPNRFNNFHAVQFDAKGVIGGDGFAFIPSVNARLLFGENVPVPFTNLIGGSMAGRYLDQQMPFIGIQNAAAMMNMLGVARTDFRFKLFKNNYLTAIANLAVTSDDLKSMAVFDEDAHAYIGAGLQYTYNTIIGPISANLHWSNYAKGVGFYVSAGFDF